MVDGQRKDLSIMDNSNINTEKDYVDVDDATSLDDVNLMSVRAVARKLDCSENWIYELISDGTLKHIRFGPGKIFIAESDLLNYIKKKRR